MPSDKANINMPNTSNMSKKAEKPSPAMITSDAAKKSARRPGEPIAREAGQITPGYRIPKIPRPAPVESVTNQPPISRPAEATRQDNRTGRRPLKSHGRPAPCRSYSDYRTARELLQRSRFIRRLTTLPSEDPYSLPTSLLEQFYSDGERRRLFDTSIFLPVFIRLMAAADQLYDSLVPSASQLIPDHRGRRNRIPRLVSFSSSSSSSSSSGGG